MKKIITLLLCFIAMLAFAADKTVEVFGESQIISDDLATAKIQAVTRAKWAAMEEAAQVEVKVTSVLHNADLLDEAVRNDVKGSIKSFTILDEGRDANTYWVQARAVVTPEAATQAMGNMAKNTSIAVIAPMIKINKVVDETHAFSEQLIAELIDNGFDVVDASMENPQLAEQISSAVMRNDMATVRALSTKLMAGSVLVGSLKVVDKGSDSGYEKVPFSIVEGSFDYRLIGNKNGKESLIYTGSISGRGQGATMDAAALNLSRSMARKDAVQVASAVSEKLMGATKKSIRVILAGNTDLQKLQELKEDIQNISWVLSIKERGSDTLIVDYAEKTYYLAAIINKNTAIPVKSFTDTEIILGSR